MPEFGNHIGCWLGGTSNHGNDFRPTSRLETHVATFPGYMAQVPRAPFSPVTKSNIEM